MKKILYTTITVLAATLLNAQNFEWALGGQTSVGGSYQTTNYLGDVCFTGVFFGTRDFDPGNGVYNLNQTTNPISGEGFICKLDANTNFIWAYAIGNISIYDMYFNSTGELFIAGNFRDTVDFDFGNGLHTLIAEGINDGFFAKIDANGNLIWVKQLSGKGNGGVSSLKINSAGHIYISSGFKDTVDFDPGIGIYNLVSGCSNVGNGYSDFAIAKYDNNGDLIWAKSIGSDTYETLGSIGIDNFGYIYAAGYFRATVDFDPGIGVFNLSPNGYSDVFLLKLDVNGDFVWVKKLGGSNTDFFSSININSNHIYLTGNFKGISDFDPDTGVYNLTSFGDYDIFISKLDLSGNFVWAKQIGGTGYEKGTSIIDDNGEIYTTGQFKETADFDPNNGLFNLTASGTNINASDVFINKLDVNGNFLWTLQIGSGGTDIGFELELDVSNSLYVSGSFQNTVDFDPGNGILNLTSSSNRSFICKLSQNGMAIEEGFTNNNKELLQIIDALGRETKVKKNEPLFYIYDDGTVEKRIVIE